MKNLNPHKSALDALKKNGGSGIPSFLTMKVASMTRLEKQDARQESSPTLRRGGKSKVTSLYVTAMTRATRRGIESSLRGRMLGEKGKGRRSWRR